MRISVAMAVYNGEKYLREQMDSILSQLTDQDELVISLNPSDDHSLDIIHDEQKIHRNIVLTECEEKGLNANKENSIRCCQGDYIFLADQDDVWTRDKVYKVMRVFETEDALLVLHNCVYGDQYLNPTGRDLFSDRHVRKGFVKNLAMNVYQGSCMAFKKELVHLILPIPRDILMHDQWIGLLAEQVGKTVFINDSLMIYRRHEDVTSTDHTPRKDKLRDMYLTTRYIHKRLAENKQSDAV